MHLLKKILQNEEEDTHNTQNNKWGWVIQRMEDLEKENTRFQTQIFELKEQNTEQSTTIQYLQDLLDSKENELNQFMNKYYTTERTQISKEDDLIRQVLEQEHKINDLSLKLEDLRQKNAQLKQNKDDCEIIRRDSLQFKNSKKQLEQIKEQFLSEKKSYEILLAKHDMEVNSLRKNLSKILNQLSIEQEKSLNLELQMQHKNAQMSKFEQEREEIIHDFEGKIARMEKLIDFFREDQIDAPTNNYNQSENLDFELKREMLQRQPQESIELEFYKQENSILEQKLKQLQFNYCEIQLKFEENESKLQIEKKIVEKQQIDLLYEKLQKSQENNNKLKQQIEDLKAKGQSVKATQLDVEISLLKALQSELQLKFKSK